MKNLKLMLAAAIVLGVGSAFTTVKNQSDDTLATVYYQHSNGIYTLAIPAGSCSVNASSPCSISYVDDPGVSSFAYADRPQTERTESTENKKGTN